MRTKRPPLHTTVLPWLIMKTALPQMALCKMPAQALHLTVVLCPHRILPMIKEPLRALELRPLSLAQLRSLQPARPGTGCRKEQGA